MKVLVLTLLLLTIPMGCNKGGSKGPLIPPNQPNAVVQVHGKWRNNPNVFVYSQETNGYDVDAMVKEVMADINGKYNFNMNVVGDVANSNVQVKFYHNPWTSKGASSAGGFKCELIVEEVPENGSVQDTEWPAPRPEDNYGGLTYIRVNSTTREITKAVVWLNLHYLMDKAHASFRKVTRHEFGHLMGFSHSEITNAVMYPYNNSSNDFIQPEQEIIQWLYGD